MANKSATEWADILGPAREFEAAVTKTRSLYNLPLVADGAKEVALLSIFKEEQRFAFEPVMRALQRLSQLTDWSHQFFVCDRVDSEFFDWRKMPLRQYSSFEDFYRRELESTWGEWEQLQRTYALVVRGKISEEDGHAEIKQRAQRAREIDALDRVNISRQGQRSDLYRAIEANDRAQRPRQRADLFDDNFVDTKESGIHEVERPTGTSTAASLRRLRKDRPDIHARVLNGELSAHAGMIEAGFRKSRPSRKRTLLEKIFKLLPKLDADGLREVRAKLDEMEGS